MTDAEIIKWLKSLEVENDYQQNKIRKAINIFQEEDAPESLSKYLNEVTDAEKLHQRDCKVAYDEYVRWCKNEGYIPETKNKFSRSVAGYYGMVSTVERNCFGEAARIYEYKFNLES